jgi:photosystem II stability/assembly factor-like uncharacterized protein
MALRSCSTSAKQRGFLAAAVFAFALLCVSASAAKQAADGATSVRTNVGPTRFVTPGFGYSVAYRTVARATTVQTTTRLFLYEAGRWRNATPPMLRTDGINTIDDVAFVDREHGWVAAYNCAKVGVYLYRTSDGGRSWRSFGKVAYHSCGGGPTYLSFTDDRHGWMEPVSPNAPEGELFGTRDGGQIWMHLASGPPVQIQRLRFRAWRRSVSSRPRRDGWGAAEMAACSRPRTAAAIGDASTFASQTARARDSIFPRSTAA